MATLKRGSLRGLQSLLGSSPYSSNSSVDGRDPRNGRVSPSPSFATSDGVSYTLFKGRTRLKLGFRIFLPVISHQPLDSPLTSRILLSAKPKKTMIEVYQALAQQIQTSVFQKKSSLCLVRLGQRKGCYVGSSIGRVQVNGPNRNRGRMYSSSFRKENWTCSFSAMVGLVARQVWEAGIGL